MKTVTFYHSAICPRCGYVKLALKSLLDDYPEIRIERVEYLTNMKGARQAGVRSIPTLVSGDQVLTGFVLTKPRIRSFLDSVA